MNKLLNKIFQNTKNERVLLFLSLKGETYFRAWRDSISGFDDGAITLFEKYGEYIPENCKYSFGIHSIMVNEHTGEIFVFNTGRLSIFFRCNFEKANIENSKDLKKGYTFDCITDINELGENWCFIDRFNNEKEQLLWSYENTQN